MLPIVTIASKLGLLREVLDENYQGPYNPMYQARPGAVVPVLIDDGTTRLVNAVWPDTSTRRIHLRSVLSKRPYNIQMRKQRCAIPVNCFFGQQEDKPFLVRLLKHRLFLLGGLYQKSGDQYSITLLTTEPADILGSLMHEMPVVFPVEKAQRWLDPGRKLEHIMAYGDKATEQWFDFFEVSSRLVNATSNSADLLTPVGKSLQERDELLNDLNAMTFHEARSHRGK